MITEQEEFEFRARAEREAEVEQFAARAEYEDPANSGRREFARRVDAGVGGLEFGASMVSKLPQAVYSGLGGLGTLMMTGDAEKAEQARQDYAKQIPGYEPQTEFGQ